MSKKAIFLVSVVVYVLIILCTGCSYNISDSEVPMPKASSNSSNNVTEKTSSFSEQTTEATSATVTETEPASVTDITETPNDFKSKVEISTATFEIPVATEKPTETTVEEAKTDSTEKPSSVATEESTVATEDVAILYGICNKNTSVKKNSDTFDLYEGQKVAIVQLGDQLEILWYGNTAIVEAEYIDVYPEDYVPDFTKGQWAGCITN